MLNKRKPGRPVTGKAKKRGELQAGLCRFTFIAEQEQVNELRRITEEEGLPIKELMSKLIGDYLKKKNKVRVSDRNEEKLKLYLKSLRNSP